MSELALPDNLNFNPKDILVLESRFETHIELDRVYSIHDLHPEYVFPGQREYRVYVRFAVLNPKLNIHQELWNLEKVGLYMTNMLISSSPTGQLEFDVDFKWFPRYSEQYYASDDIDELEYYPALPD